MTIEDGPPPEASAPFADPRRPLRWAAIALVVVLPALGLLFAVPIWALAIAGLVLVVAVWAGLDIPERRPAARKAPRRGAVWPDTGMRVVADSLGDPCLLVDATGIVRFINREATARFGTLKPGDPLSFRLRVTALLDALDRVVALDQSEAVEWQERIPTECWLEARLAPIHYPPDPTGSDRRPDFVLIVIEDLTERRRTDRMRADFVANASHELRTPLASLSGFIETLQGPARNDEKARERFLAIMAEQAARMKRLIDDLLSLSRVEMKAHVRPDTRIDLVEILNHVVDSLDPLAADAGVEVEIRTAVDVMPVLGDRDELTQVFSNLVENAVKYGRDGKRVEITASSFGEPGGPRPKLWQVTVRDFGPGIDKVHLPRLTERFYRADIDSSREKRGTGLGLAIVKHIVARHRGRLLIDSNPGEGATFTVRLEAEEQAPDSQNPGKEKEIQKPVLSRN